MKMWQPYSTLPASDFQVDVVNPPIYKKKLKNPVFLYEISSFLNDGY